MTHEQIIRLIFLALIMVFVPFALFHRIRSVTDEKLDRWQEGPFILFGLRLGGIPWLLGCIAWMIDPAWLKWSSIGLPLSVRYGGIALVALWGGLFVWTFRSLGANLTDTVVTRKDHTLVTSGPYRFVRHPFYLAFFIAVIGVSVVFDSWYLFLTGLLPCGFLVARTGTEEEKLIERFGDDYRAYMSKTGRFFPRAAR